jgi:hypothetical protein
VSYVVSAVNNTYPFLAQTWLWMIELHNGQDSRLTDKLIDQGLKPALDVVEREWREGWRESNGRGALILVGRRDQDKFFSNGKWGTLERGSTWF